MAAALSGPAAAACACRLASHMRCPAASSPLRPRVPTRAARTAPMYCLYCLQLFIFYTIQQYGALHFALIMTMRQFLSIVLSCLIFSHDLAATQW